MSLIRQRASVLCVNNGRALLVGLREPTLGEVLWFPPGGAVEPGEAPVAAARREALEETGYRVQCLEPGHVLRYPFQWGDRSFACETTFFDAELLADAPVAPVDPLVADVRWSPVTDLPQLFTYADPLRAFLLRRYAELADSRRYAELADSRKLTR